MTNYNNTTNNTNTANTANTNVNKTFIRMNRCVDKNGNPFISAVTNIFIRDAEQMQVSKNGRNFIRFKAMVAGAGKYIETMCGVAPDEDKNGNVYINVVAYDSQYAKVATQVDHLVHSPKLVNKNIKATITGPIKVEQREYNGKTYKTATMTLDALDLLGSYDVKEGSVCRTLAQPKNNQAPTGNYGQPAYNQPAYGQPTYGGGNFAPIDDNDLDLPF